MSNFHPLRSNINDVVKLAERLLNNVVAGSQKSHKESDKESETEASKQRTNIGNYKVYDGRNGVKRSITIMPCSISAEGFMVAVNINLPA